MKEIADAITQIVRAGFTAESVVKAVSANDYSLLEHTGKVDRQIETEE